MIQSDFKQGFFKKDSFGSISTWGNGQENIYKKYGTFCRFFFFLCKSRKRQVRIKALNKFIREKSTFYFNRYTNIFMLYSLQYPIDLAGSTTSLSFEDAFLVFCYLGHIQVLRSHKIATIWTLICSLFALVHIWQPSSRQLSKLFTRYKNKS